MILNAWPNVAKGIVVLGGGLLAVYGLSKCSEKVFAIAFEKASRLAFK